MQVSIIEAAKVTGGKITEVHDNWCPSLAEQPGACNCAEVSYRLIINSKRLVSRLAITGKAVR